LNLQIPLYNGFKIVSCNSRTGFSDQLVYLFIFMRLWPWTSTHIIFHLYFFIFIFSLRLWFNRNRSGIATLSPFSNLSWEKIYIKDSPRDCNQYFSHFKFNI